MEENTGPRVTTEQMRDVDRLRRSSSDRYLAGVAGGLGRHFDVDPTLVRVVLVVLALFGGAGLLVYGAVWLLVPDDRRSRAVVDLSSEARRILLLLTGALAVGIALGTPLTGNNLGLGIPVPLIVVGLGIAALVLSRDHRRTARATPPAPWPGAPAATSPAQPEGTAMTQSLLDPATPAPGPPTAPPAWMPPPPVPGYVPPPRPRRTGVVLFWPTLALVAIALGTLGIVDIRGTVQPSAYVALALAVIAVMLVVGAFIGRPGGLIALGLLTALGLGVTSAVEASTDWNTGGENLTETPLSAAAVRDVYTVPNGQIALDLSRVRNIAALDGRELDLHLNAGQIRVTLPRGVNAVVDADMHFAGDIRIAGSDRSGFGQSLTRTVAAAGVDPQSAPTLRLHLDARAGQITVTSP